MPTHCKTRKPLFPPVVSLELSRVGTTLIPPLSCRLPRRLRAIQVEIVSALEPNCGIIDSLRQNVLQLKELCSALIELHGTLCRCLDLVKTQGLSSAAGNTKTDLEGIAEFIKSLFSLQDYSLAYPDIRQPAQDLALVLGTPAQADSAEKLSATIQALNWCKLSVESKIAEQKGKRYPSTPLYTLVDTIWNTVSKAHELAVGDFKGNLPFLSSLPLIFFFWLL